MPKLVSGGKPRLEHFLMPTRTTSETVRPGDSVSGYSIIYNFGTYVAWQLPRPGGSLPLAPGTSVAGAVLRWLAGSIACVVDLWQPSSIATRRSKRVVSIRVDLPLIVDQWPLDSCKPTTASSLCTLHWIFSLNVLGSFWGMVMDDQRGFAPAKHGSAERCARRRLPETLGPETAGPELVRPIGSSERHDFGAWMAISTARLGGDVGNSGPEPSDTGRS